MKPLVFVIAGLLLMCSRVHAGDDPAQKLKELEALIAKAPEDPMLLYRKAQCLMKLARFEQGYQTAQDAMALFIEKENDLSWMMIEQIDLGHVRIDVHFNMGPSERKPPETGIIRPLSFRIWAQGEKPGWLEIIDFEIGLSDGKPLTAALGQMRQRDHVNFGILDTELTYAQIRKRLVELVECRHKSPSRAVDLDKKLPRQRKNGVEQGTLR